MKEKVACPLFGDSIDKKILNIIQKEFPVVTEPFKVIAERVGITEDEALERISRLKQEGIIRRIGAVFDSRKMGFVSTLCAARVPEEKLKAFVEAVNSYAGVTHNYRRNHEYNVWFTFIAPDEETLEKSLVEICDRTGVGDVISMPAVRTFKIDASFEL
jgi:DNA-binding Lrp family transcriptional regulator